MAGEKISVPFEIQADAEKMLEYAATTYGLPDKHKAMRCLLDYLAKDMFYIIWLKPGLLLELLALL